MAAESTLIGGASTSPSAAETRARVRQVFAFLRAFAERRAPVVRRLEEVARKLQLSDLPDHPSIKLGVVTLRAGAGGAGGRDDEEAAASEPLLRVRRPTLTKPPPPPEGLVEWLAKGWERPDGKVAVLDLRSRRARGKLATERSVDDPARGKLATERFVDDPARGKALAAYRRTWERWAVAERPAREAMRIFEALYALHGDIEREGERIELVMADARLVWQTMDGPIDHPVLLQRVDLVFDPDVPEFRVVDSDRTPELYGPLLLAGGTLSGEKLNELSREVEAGGYHPLNGAETDAFLRRLVSFLGPGGSLRQSEEGDADDELSIAPPEGPVIVRDGWLLARDRAAGFAAAFDRVLEDVAAGAELPAALLRIVGAEPSFTPGGPSQPAPLWGEPADVLLSKPANAEQIAIVRALERHHAVLVQGPPGTGKSHTIANLIGHLVAQGKRVLVTSHATKALRVLREHVVEELRPLCVALLDNDLEGRAQLEQAVRVIVHRLSTSTEDRLVSDIETFGKERERLIGEVERLTAELRAARENEYRPIVVAAEELAPADAARFVERNARLAWIPGPVDPGAPLPLSETEFQELYGSNNVLSPDDEEELASALPLRSELPPADVFDQDVALIRATAPSACARFWRSPPRVGDEAPLAALARAVEGLAREISGLQPWQRRLVGAGRSGDGESALWQNLADQVERAAAAWQAARPLLLDHAPAIAAALPRREVIETLTEIEAHVKEGRALGGISLLFRSKWKTILDGCRTNGAPPTEPAHFEALLARARIEQARADLATRWSRQAEPVGLPGLTTLPDPPEPTLLDFVNQFDRLLALWPTRFRQIEAQLAALGFRSDEFRADEVARAAPNDPFETDVALLGGALLQAIERRREAVARLTALERCKAVEERLARGETRVCRGLSRAVVDLDPAVYRREHGRLEQLWVRQATLTRRRALLEALAARAPEWADAIASRHGIHGAPSPPRELAAAFRYRQLEQELQRRAGPDERALASRLDGHVRQLRNATVQLVDRKAWLAQLRRTGLEARQALIGWADTQRKIGKGTGKRAPALQLRARELLTRAREAVPVWIMPLSRVAESFDPRQGRFDVVIIDEASQCDLTGLLALYLGAQVAIVGDHEQVSPSAIGESVEETTALISQHLGDIPNSHLYDGQTSVYDLARQSFGGTIGLREHFRCVPEIIEFSNQLSYSGEIRPLRDPASALRPHVVEYQVPAALEANREGKVNEPEGRAVAALIAAAMGSPEYDGKTFGAISLLGDAQASLIQRHVQELVPLEEIGRRRFVAGNPAHFQGDERDVVFLSMVDVPDARPLPLQERTSFKQRYNVAASRAKDQLWLVHSLDPRRDLHPQDLRRRLIEHVRAPTALRRRDSRQRRPPSSFEADVIDRLVRAGFAAEAQVEVGSYCLDVVVTDGRRQVAIECDGDRFHALERLDDEIARQAVLERVGWRFIRLRATRFIADPPGTMDFVLRELDRLAVEPVGDGGAIAGDGDPDGENLRSKIVRRAWQIMREHDWISGDEAPPRFEPRAGASEPHVDAATPADLVEDTTEPAFVILEERPDRC